jgi:hypothetical protein
VTQSTDQRKAQAAWDRIEALGGHGVWERELVIVSFGNSGVRDEDLAIFRDFPYIQILDLSHTKVGDNGLKHLANLPALKDLIVVGTPISEQALEEFRRDHPSVTVTTEPPPKGSINPFTGKAFGSDC